MKSLFVLIFLVFSLAGFSQSYSFKSYSVAEGLSQSQVTSITEDEDGYLWVGTLGGLSRFNGSKFTNYSSEDGLLNNRITSLFLDRKELWIGHESGVSLYKDHTFSTWSIHKDNVNITDITKFKNKLILASFGEGIYILSGGKLNQVKFKSADQNVVRRMAIVGKTLYLGTKSGVFYSSDLKTFKKLALSTEINVSSLTSLDNGLLIASIEGKIYQYDIQSGELSVFYSYPSMTFSKQFLIDEKNVWVANSLGLTFIDQQKNIELINSNKGLPLESLNCLFKDRNGTFWIGSDGKGLFRFAGPKINYFNIRNGIESDLITSSNQFGKQLIFGSYDHGLIYFDNNTFRTLDLPNNTVWATVVDNQKQIWVASQNGLFAISPNRRIQSYARDEKISSFYEENDNLIWVGGTNGLHYIKNGSYIEDSTQAFSFGTIRSITKYQGEILCGTDAGLYFFKQGQFQPVDHFTKRISSLKTDLEGRCWIGTEEGLYVFDGQKISLYPLANEPAAKFINFINYQNDQLYVGTNNGLYVLATKKRKEIQYFGLDEGLVNLETNINSSFFDREGNFWFGTAEGLMRFELHSGHIKQNDAQPFLNVLAIKVNYELLDEKKYLLETTAQGVKKLRLPYNKNNIIIELDGVLLKKYALLSYEYWLEGSEQSWTPNYANPIVTLSNLPSGEYTLHIRAKNGIGTYSKPFLIKLEIQPVFYKTWWFLLLMIGAVSLLIYGGLMLRINREKRERLQEALEYKAKLLTLEQQTLNASMNRHFIFNSLNSIQYFINTQDRVSANKFLSNFAKLIRMNLDSSAEDGGMVSLQEELERLELYLSLESMRFVGRFEFHIDVDPNIDVESIKIPSMLLQPYVENSIIHGILPQQDIHGKISITLKLENGKLIICIDDNGLGVDTSLKKKGLNSGDHKSKGMEITSKRIDILNKFNLPIYEIEGPFQLVDKNHSIKGTRVLLKIMLKNLENQN